MAVRAWLPALAWMGLIFVLSAQPGLRVSEDAAVDAPLRSLAHVAAFGVLGCLVALALAPGRELSPRRALLAIVLATLYGALDEVHQAFVPDRTAQLEDLVLDAAGVIAGVTVVWLAGRVRRVGRGTERA